MDVFGRVGEGAAVAAGHREPHHTGQRRECVSVYFFVDWLINHDWLIGLRTQTAEEPVAE